MMIHLATMGIFKVKILPAHKLFKMLIPGFMRQYSETDPGFFPRIPLALPEGNPEHGCGAQPNQTRPNICKTKRNLCLLVENSRAIKMMSNLFSFIQLFLAYYYLFRDCFGLSTVKIIYLTLASICVYFTLSLESKQLKEKKMILIGMPILQKKSSLWLFLWQNRLTSKLFSPSIPLIS